MIKKIITNQSWKRLYNFARGFKNLNPWNWLYDTHLFGVQNPDTREIGYCCVLGNLGEMFALCLYQGAEGLYTYNLLRSDKKERYELVFRQKCLMVSFEEKKFLQKEDFHIIKKLRLAFSGSNAWPLFRSYLPGYYPWFLSTADEVNFLAVGLEQTIEVATRFLENPSILNFDSKKPILHRIPVKKNGQIVWRDEWKEAESYIKPNLSAKKVDKIRCQKIKMKGLSKQQCWEFDFFFSNDAVQEQESGRPFFPNIVITVDHHSGFIINHVLENPSDISDKIADVLLQAIESARILPKELWVKKKDIYVLIEPVCKYLNITLKKVSKLEEVERVKKYFQNIQR